MNSVEEVCEIFDNPERLDRVRKIAEKFRKLYPEMPVIIAHKMAMRIELQYKRDVA